MTHAKEKIMKKISYLLTFAIKAFAYCGANLKSAFDPIHYRHYSKRVVLIPFRSANDQPQLLALPIAYFEEACHPRFLDIKD
jgi:hypothetical protein